MSNAEPMGMQARVDRYKAQSGVIITPRRYRRVKHKNNRARGNEIYLGMGGKGRPTPRQRRPRRG